MKVGLCLPVFRADPALALAVARQAEDEGLDGVFCFDHMFPIGRPDRPSLAAFPVLAAVAQHTLRVRIGPLVTRVGLMPEPFLVGALATLNDQAEGRAIAGLGLGDRLSRAEHDAYGIPFRPLDERVAMLSRVADALAERGVRTWVGGRSGVARRLAFAHADGWNAWEAEASDFEGVPQGQEVSWGGLPPEGHLGEHLQSMRDLGVAWVVYAPAPSIEWAPFVTKLGGASQVVK